jgi:hypothetical protein
LILSGTTPPVPTNCKPDNIYTIYNFYCSLGVAQNLMTELTLPFPAGGSNSCSCFEPNDIHNSPAFVIAANKCDPVQAFIGVTDNQYINNEIRPVFYRCYWHNDVDVVGLVEYVQFEWSATAEYIYWYISNLTPNGTITPINPIVDPLSIIPFPYLVPLLKVTNHSPNLP